LACGQEVSVSVSVLALVVVSVDRYIAVIHPLRRRLSARVAAPAPTRPYRPHPGRVAAAVMLGVWLVGVASGLPAAVVFRVVLVPGDRGPPTKPFCTSHAVQRSNLPHYAKFHQNRSHRIAEISQLTVSKNGGRPPYCIF